MSFSRLPICPYYGELEITTAVWAKMSQYLTKWELIKQSKLLKIKSKFFLNLFNEKYGLKLGEFNNTTGNERVNK